MIEGLCDSCNSLQLDSQRDVLACLSGLEQTFSEGSNFDLHFLNGYIKHPQISSLLKIYDCLNTREEPDLNCILPDAEDIVYDIRATLIFKPHLSCEARELENIFRKPHFQALISSYDQIRSNMYEHHMESVSTDTSETEEEQGTGPVRIVRLLKEEQEPLGITVRYFKNKGCCLVTRIMSGGTVSRSGVLTMGDEIYEINGISLQGKRIEEILTMLHFSVNSVSLKIVPVSFSPRVFPRENTVYHVKCHFSYNPRKDTLLACQEAGLCFNRNDILHVFDRTDTVWWQARKQDDSSGRPGLIPSKILQERRLYQENLRNALKNRNNGKVKKCPLNNKGSKRKFKKKKIMYSSDYKEDFDTPPFLTYEEVIELSPSYEKPRPIVLVGPRSVGRNELRRLLISSDPERFITPVNYPSRKQFDKDNKKYFYTDCYDGRTVQATYTSFTIEHKGDYERISVDSVRRLMNLGKCCVFVIPPQELPIIRTRELLPYIIFIKPPSLQRLRQSRLMSRVKKSSLQNQNRKVFTLTDLQEMLRKAEEIDTKYGQYFDLTITNEDLQDAYDQLYTAAYLVAKETQWIPVNWLS